MNETNYWHIQLLQGRNDKSFTEVHLQKALNLGVIGMGEGWENDGGAPRAFSHSMKIGDIVMIRHGGGPRALVEITGEVFSNDGGSHADLWFEIMRKVRVLCWRGFEVRDRYNTMGSRTWKEGLYLPTTFQSANNSDFIKKWHSWVIREQLMDKFTNLLKSNKNLILTGPPGTGKTYLARQIAEAIQGMGASGDGVVPAGGRFAFVQFHPSYDYTDFVEGLKPTENDDGQIVFRPKDGIFKSFCKEAGKYEDRDSEEQSHPFVFVIDEINRADLSRVFGELFYALEPSYRGERGQVKTQYSSLFKDEKDFYIPKNVYIIGTMNDIDRSVDSMDFALRRRFAWSEVEADDTRFDSVMEGVLDNHPDLKEQAKMRYRNLNKQIAGTPALGAHYQIGPAYYRNLRSFAIDGMIWDAFWDRHLQTLVNEYVRGLPDAAKLMAKFRAAFDDQPAGVP